MAFDLLEVCTQAKLSKYSLQLLSEEEKNRMISLCADALENEYESILEANKIDMEHAAKKNMAAGLQDRLRLTKERISDMAVGLRQIVALPSPIGEILESFERPNGLKMEKIRVPMGVIGIIYEARPNVTADAFGLCMKTGNVVILKGGSDATSSNLAIVKLFRHVLKENGFNENWISYIDTADRSVTTEFMKMNQYIDLLIPRGGAGLIRSVVENATIPVIETGTGNCHIFVDKSADLSKAIPIIINAKTQRIGVCNACESLLIHEAIKDEFLPKLCAALKENNVEIRGDQEVCRIFGDAVPATEEDYGKEYLDYIISMKVVSNVEEAIDHINTYHTCHSDAILTQNDENADLFLKMVDSACVYVNASTRFTDGFEFGFGAEIGISTQKLHARGPMGLKELTSYKYLIKGNGQIRE